MRKSGFTLTELLMASVVLAVIAAIAIPSFTRMQKRAKEAEVKSVAHSLQMAVEDFKTCPMWLGLKPEHIGQFNHLVTSYLPNNVIVKQNPFQPGTFYGTPGANILFQMPPAGLGQVTYFATIGKQEIPYTIGAMGGEPNLIILTLVEE